MKSGIYMWTSPSEKKYVGQAQDLADRKKRFLNPKRKYSGTVGSEELTAIDRARKKYPDFSKWKYEVLEYCSIEQLNEREEYWIAFYKSNVKGIGYNMTVGGDGIRGFHPSEETREKQRLAKLGKKQTWERAPLSFSSRRKMSECKIKNNERVYGYSVETGELLYVFPNVITAANYLGIVNANILKVCNGKRTLAGGIYWSYSIMDEHGVIDTLSKRKEDTHLKKSNANTERLLKKHPSAIPVIEVNKDGSKTQWANAKRAAEFYGFSSCSIHRAIKAGTRRANGSTWYYLSEVESGVEPIYYERRKDRIKIPHRTRKVVAIFPNGSEREFESIKDAETILGLGKGSVSKVLSPKQPHKTAGGISFRYAS